MLPVCSATPNCTSHSQISFHGGQRPCTPSWKDLHSRCSLEAKPVINFSNGNHIENMSVKAQATKSFYYNFMESSEQSLSMDLVNGYTCPNELDDIGCKFSNGLSSLVGERNESVLGKGELKYVESFSEPASGEEIVDFMTQSATDGSIGTVGPETISTVDIRTEDPSSVSSFLNLENDSLSSVKTSVDDFLARTDESINSLVTTGENAVKGSIDKVTSLITSTTRSASEAIDSSISRVLSTAGDKFSILPTDLKAGSNKAAVITLDLLRRTIIVVEDSLSNGTSYLVYYYDSAKGNFPPEIRDALNLYEERAIKALKPIGAALQQVFIAIKALEVSLGLDPNDPIVPFLLLLGTSATLWVFYWLWTYGGYSGDLSPTLTLELLSGDKNAVLVDVRPEVLREREGIPDLRRAARSRYASVTLPEVNGSIRKLLKSGRGLDETLIAAVIRNLKGIQDRSKVIVMDADGSRSKGIARSLRKLGVKKAYMVQGGFQSWAKQGLRIKELKPETALSILNEEAEAILEDINPSPIQFVGYGVGLVAALYALTEWEIALQLIGVVGLGLTIYIRVSSYENSEDLKKDVRLLLAPVRLGAQAFSWAAGKLETNRIGLPTSPSSSDVQSRVLQAAAKHESQPSDAERTQDSSPESMAPMNEKVDLSEA